MLINTYVNAKIVITYDFKKGDIWCSMIKSYASIKKVCSVFELKNAFDCKHSQIVITLIINYVLILIKSRFATDLIWKDYGAADGPCCKCLICLIESPSPPLGGGNFCPKWKTGKNLKEDLKKGKEKGGKEEKKKVEKHTLKYLYEA